MAKQVLSDSDENFRIKISENSLSVTLELLRSNLPPNCQQAAINLLKKAGIVYGIKMGAISRLIEEKKIKSPRLIARGISPIPGEDGYWKILIDTSEKPVPEKYLDGTVDYHRVRRFVEVKEGRALARHCRSFEGTNGKDCLGKEVMAPPVEDKAWKLGEGTRFPKGNPDLVEASRGGILTYKEGTLTVVDELNIKGSVGPETGDINVKVPVTIEEYVIPDFLVRSTKNITIKGCVQSARVECEGDLLVKRGILGDPPSKVQVKGNLQTGYLEHSFVEVEGNVLVDRSVSNSVISSGGKVEVKRNLFGSQIVSEGRVFLSQLGSETGSACRVFAGYDHERRKALATRFQSRLSLLDKLKKVKLKITEIKQEAQKEERASQGGRGSKSMSTKSAESALVRKFVAQQTQIMAKLKQINEEEEKILQNSPAVEGKEWICTAKGVVPGTILAVGGAKLILPIDLTGKRAFDEAGLKNSSRRLLAVGSEEFRKTVESWAESLDLWNLLFAEPHKDFVLAAKSFLPDTFILEARSLNESGQERFKKLLKNDQFADALLLLFSDGVPKELLDSWKGDRTTMISEPPAPSVIDQFAKALGIEKK